MRIIYHPELTGFPDTEKIQQSIELIREKARDYEFRTTVIDSIHTDEQMHHVQQLVHGSKRYALQAFVPRPELPDSSYRNIPRTPSSRLHDLKNKMAGCAEEVLLRGA